MDFTENLFQDDEDLVGDSGFVVECPFKKIKLDCEDKLEDASFVTTFESSEVIDSNGDDYGNQFNKQQEASAVYENQENMEEEGDGGSENGKKLLV